MDNLTKYIKNTIGINIHIESIPNAKLDGLPLFLKLVYNFHIAEMLNCKLLFIKPKNNKNFSIKQTGKQFEILMKYFQEEIPVMLFDHLDALGRRRLVAKNINFVVPGKQLFIPQLMIDLREIYRKPAKNAEKLLPSSQLIVFHYILNRNNRIEEKNFRQLSSLFHYSTMAITKAANNLDTLKLCSITGEKDKFLRLDTNIATLWEKAYPYLINPVKKRVFVDNLPEGENFLRANETALAQYSDMAESRQAYLAVDGNTFYDLVKKNVFLNMNENEGTYCLEVWKYNPFLLATDNAVDPLSLYVSLQDLQDERIEMALDKIKDKYIW